MSDNNGSQGQDGHKQIKGTVIQQGKPPHQYETGVLPVGAHVERTQEHTRKDSRVVHGISAPNVGHNLTGPNRLHDAHPIVRAHKARERGE